MDGADGDEGEDEQGGRKSKGKGKDKKGKKDQSGEPPAPAAGHGCEIVFRVRFSSRCLQHSLRAGVPDHSHVRVVRPLHLHISRCCGSR